MRVHNYHYQTWAESIDTVKPANRLTSSLWAPVAIRCPIPVHQCSPTSLRRQIPKTNTRHDRTWPPPSPLKGQNPGSSCILPRFLTPSNSLCCKNPLSHFDPLPPLPWFQVSLNSGRKPLQRNLYSHWPLVSWSYKGPHWFIADQSDHHIVSVMHQREVQTFFYFSYYFSFSF